MHGALRDPGLRKVAQALDLSAETLLAQAGFWGGSPGPAASARATSDAELAIRNDAQLTDPQKEALLSVYRSYIAANRGS